MPKHCPGCKRFMVLDRGGPMERGEMLWARWECTNEDCWQHDHPIDAPEYDWEHYGLSDVEIEELRAEYPDFAAHLEAERDAYHAMIQSRRKQVF